MSNILDVFLDGSNQWLNIFFLLLALLRVYLEIVQFDFLSLPLTKQIFQGDSRRACKFHRQGLFICLGYIVLFAPFTLFS